MPDNSTDKTINPLPSVAVVILNWNGRAFLERFLPSVVASSYSNKRIIIADNHSSDDSVEYVKQNYPFIEIILNGSNAGFAKGYNLALEKVNADYFVLLNSDVEVTPGWIEPVITLMGSDPKIAACQPKLLDEKHRNKFEYAGACGGWIDCLGYPFARGRVLDHIETDSGQYDRAERCFWASGAAMFVRASVYKELGGLDEYFFAHQEEIDLCWRMQLKGYSIWSQPASVVYHVGGGTLPKGNNKKAYLNFRNNLIMIYKNVPVKRLLFLLPFRMFLDGVAAWKEFFSGNPGYCVAVARAHVHFVKWVFFKQHCSLFVKQNQTVLKGKYNGSIIWDLYIKKKKTFSEIMDVK